MGNELEGHFRSGGEKIDVNKELQSTGNLATAFLKIEGEADPYVYFVYAPQTIFNYTWGQLLASINTNQINVNKQSNNQNVKVETKTPKEIA